MILSLASIAIRMPGAIPLIAIPVTFDIQLYTPLQETIEGLATGNKKMEKHNHIIMTFVTSFFFTADGSQSLVPCNFTFLQD